jgi:hypothetical protein
LVALLNGAEQIPTVGQLRSVVRRACRARLIAAVMVEPRLTAAEAATRIVGLINSRPATPWPHEIEAIIARIAPMVPAATLTLPDHVVAYRAKTQEFYRHSKHVMGPLTFDAPNHDVVYERDTELGRQAKPTLLAMCCSPRRPRRGAI